MYIGRKGLALSHIAGIPLHVRQGKGTSEKGEDPGVPEEVHLGSGRHPKEEGMRGDSQVG